MPDITPTCVCGKEDWLPIPDSLAIACKECGNVLVATLGGTYERGASLQQWAADMAAIQRGESISEQPND